MCRLNLLASTNIMPAKSLKNGLFGATLVKFMMVGGVGALILLGLMWVLVDVLGLHYLLSLPLPTPPPSQAITL